VACIGASLASGSRYAVPRRFRVIREAGLVRVPG